MWIIQHLSELIGLQIHSTNANFGLWTAKIKYIFRTKQQIFCFLPPLFVTGCSATFSAAVVQNLSLRSGCCTVPRATAANITSIYNLPASLHLSILLFPGVPVGWQNTPVSHFGSDWSWRAMQGTLPWPGGERTLSGRQSADRGRDVERCWYVRLINRGSKD